MISLRDVVESPKLFQPWFKGDSWTAWHTFLAVLSGAKLTDARERKIYRRYTGRHALPQQPFTEAWLIAGRRGGKSQIAALVAVYLACFRDYAKYLAPGEVATVMLLAADRRQARVIMRYVSGFFHSIPTLQAMIINQTKESIELGNRVVIEIHTSSFRSTRGYTLAAVICDEIAFWRSDESANPDKEILNALRPGLASMPGSLMLCISSPYARRGSVWEAYRKHFGKDGDPVLVWQAPTRAMNPTIPQEIIDTAYAEDESAASAEYGALFRRDIESYVSKEAVDACVIPGRREQIYVTGIRYSAFVDAAGGSGQDSYTMAIAHKTKDGVSILDAVKEWKPPFSPEQVTEEAAKLMAAYHVSDATADRYAGDWPVEQFRKHGIRIKPAEKPKSDIYKEFLSPLNSGNVELLDNARLIAQLCNLERKTGRGGKDSIDHGPGGHDDLVNAAAGALLASTKKSKAFWFAVNIGEPQSAVDLYWPSVNRRRMS